MEAHSFEPKEYTGDVRDFWVSILAGDVDSTRLTAFGSDRETSMPRIMFVAFSPFPVALKWVPSVESVSR